jgi:hypothetical protein
MADAADVAGYAVVHGPLRRHHCGVGSNGDWWTSRPLPDDHHLRAAGITDYLTPVGEFDPPGTIRACPDCDRTWVAHTRPPGARWIDLSTCWRPEGRIARWRRQRRNRQIPNV